MKERIYIGNYSNEIIICNFNNGKLEIVNKIKHIEKPSYLNVNGDILYSVSETKTGGIIAFRIENDSLKKINEKVIDRALPCYISSDIKREKLLVSNFSDGSISMYNLEKNGTIGDEIAYQRYVNAHMHFSEFSGNDIYIVDMNNDMISIYNKNLEKISELKVKHGSGPRHIAIDQNMMYIVTEISNEILVYKKENSEWSLVQEISTLKSVDKTSYAGAIKLSKNKKNIYVTNRGDDTISVFCINDNKLQLIQNIPSYGEFPRDITLNSTEEYAIVANQKSNNLVLFKRNLENGMLEKIENADVLIDSPSCVVRSIYEI